MKRNTGARWTQEIQHRTGAVTTRGRAETTEDTARRITTTAELKNMAIAEDVTTIKTIENTSLKELR